MDPVKEHFQQGYGNMVDINMNIVYYGEKQWSDPWIFIFKAI